MIQHLKLLIFLGLLFLVVNSFLPSPDSKKLAGGLEGLSGTPITVTYQKGDGKGNVSETDDGTISSRYVEGTVSRPREYDGQGGENSLSLKRIVETSGGETTIETKRILIKFPNIIGGGGDQIPRGATINSVNLKLVLNAFNSSSALSASIYLVLEDWTEAESGYLKSPSWRERVTALSESDTATQWTNFGVDTPTSSESPPTAEAVQIPSTLGGTASLDITKAVEAWMDGKPNNGIMLKLFGETPGGTIRLVSFYSSEWGDVSLRPKLEIVYTPKITEPEPTNAVTPAPTAIPATTTAVPVSPPPPPVQPAAEPQKSPRQPSFPAPKPVISLRPAPAETKEPPAAAPPSPRIEERLQPGFIQNVFIVIQRNILKTWAKIIELLR